MELSYAVIAVYICFFLIYAIIFLIKWLIKITEYILLALSYMKIARKLSIENSFLAFIPYANSYLIGKIAEKDDKICHPEKKSVKWSVILPVSEVAAVILIIVELIITYAAILIPSLFASTESEQAPVASVLALIIGVFVMLMTCVALLIVCYICSYKVYHVMAKENAWWMLLLTILFPPIAEIVILLVLAFSKKFPIAPKPDTPSADRMVPENISE